MELNKETILEDYQRRMLELKSSIIESKDYKYSNLILFKDYVSRLTLWKERLEVNNRYLKTRESHNIMIYLNDFYKKIFNEEPKVIIRRNFNSTFLHLYVCWEIFDDIFNFSKEEKLPKPYESIIKVILKGGFVSIYNGVYEIDIYSLLIGSIVEGKDKLFLPTLEDGFLDLLDNNFKKRNLLEQKEIDKIYNLWIMPASNNITSEEEAIINDTEDVKIIARNLNIPENIIMEVKEHYWISEHLIINSKGFFKGRFIKDDFAIVQWGMAVEGFKTSKKYRPEAEKLPDYYEYIEKDDAKDDFIFLIAYGYIESKLTKLIKKGLNYKGVKSFNRNGNPIYNIGSHELSVVKNRENESILEFYHYGRSLYPLRVNRDLTNLEEIINYVSNYTD